MKILYSNDTFDAGKHKGKTVEQAFNEDPSYVKTFNSAFDSKTPSSFRNNTCISDETINCLVLEDAKRRLQPEA